MHHFCTQFDSHYLTNGLALYRSIARSCDDFTLYVNALDDKTFRVFEQLDRENVALLNIGTIEDNDDELLRARGTRPRVQYYFTCVPALNAYLLEEYEMDRLTYFGADLYFYANVQSLINMMEGASIVVHTHRRPEGADTSSGIFNAEFVSFANDETGRACVESWRENCIDWCYGRAEDGKWSNQGYLEDWPDRYDDVRIIDHPGVGLARWNRETHSLSEDGGEVRVDGEPLIFYHFSNLQRLTQNVWKPPILDLTDIEQSLIYEPYLEALLDAEETIRTETGEQPDFGSYLFPRLDDIGDASLRAIGRTVLHGLSAAKRYATGDLIITSR